MPVLAENEMTHPIISKKQQKWPDYTYLHTKSIGKCSHLSNKIYTYRACVVYSEEPDRLCTRWPDLFPLYISKMVRWRARRVAPRGEWLRGIEHWRRVIAVLLYVECVKRRTERMAKPSIENENCWKWTL